MNIDNLVKMANQIESFFRVEEVRDVAVAGIESHIKRYWEPRMRAEIIRYVEAGGEGLGELAKSAIRKLAEASKAPHSG